MDRRADSTDCPRILFALSLAFASLHVYAGNVGLMLRSELRTIGFQSLREVPTLVSGADIATHKTPHGGMVQAMSDPVTVALITAISSIVVAWLNRPPRPRRRR